MQSGTQKAVLVSLLSITAIFAFAVVAGAMTVPTDPNALAYDAWDIFVTQGIKGPIGASVVVALVAIGAYEFKRSPMIGGATLVTGSLIAKSDLVAKSLGAMLN